MTDETAIPDERLTGKVRQFMIQMRESLKLELEAKAEEHGVALNTEISQRLVASLNIKLAEASNQDATISKQEHLGSEAAALDRRLREEQLARAAAEREVQALKTEKHALEHRVTRANRTLAHGLGRALIEAQSFRGVIALPGKIRRLRLKQKAKRRERVPNSFSDNVSVILQLVDPALERADRDGPEAAVEWVIGQGAEPETKARALVEIAHWLIATDPDRAAQIGSKAAGLVAGEHRLLSLAAALREKGMVLAPAKLCAGLGDRLPLSLPQQKLIARIGEDAAILDTGSWGKGLICAGANIDRASSLAIIRSERWEALPGVRAVHTVAENLGWPVQAAAMVDRVGLAEISAAHIFAESLGMACSVTAEARTAGCGVILDIANPPKACLMLPESELAVVELARLRGLAAITDILIVRSQSLANLLKLLDIPFEIVTDDEEFDQDSITDRAIAAAYSEYGAGARARTIACCATLDDDPGLATCIETFATAVAEEITDQLLIFGKGHHVSAWERKTETLGIRSRVHFLGLPPIQRWPALLAMVDLVLFPRDRQEALGSEIPMLFNQAVRQNKTVLANKKAWQGQITWQSNPDDILRSDSVWGDMIKQRIGVESSVVRMTGAAKSLSALYMERINSS